MLRIEKILLTFNKIEERLRKTNDAIIKLKEVTTTLKKTDLYICKYNLRKILLYLLYI